MFRKPDGAGKGDVPRPIPNRKQFEDNWDNIFKKKQDDPATTVLRETEEPPEQGKP